MAAILDSKMEDKHLPIFYFPDIINQCIMHDIIISLHAGFYY